MAIINIHSAEAEASADFKAFVRDWKAPATYEAVPDTFVEEDRYLEARGANTKLSDPDMLDLTAAEEVAPLGGGVDWDEAKQAGLHLPSGNIVRPSGDGFYNEFGNGAHHLSTLGAMMLSEGTKG